MEKSAARDSSHDSWLGKSAAILALTFPIDVEAGILADGRRYADNPNVMSHQAYEPQVGVPRIIDMLSDVGVRATFFVPGITAERWPDTVSQILNSGHEVAHHSYSHRIPLQLTEAEERRDFERCLEALERLGIKPRGHRSAVWTPRWTTAALVAEYGLVYETNLMDDDRPYILQTTKGEIAEIPPHWSLDDFSQYAFMWDPKLGSNVESPRKATEVWMLELEAMRELGCLMQLTCHPFLSGRPGRVKALREFIERVQGFGDVEILTCGEIADRVLRDPAAIRRVHEPIKVDPSIYPEY
jgi:peptidoglycan/xylan/chitin deacetylase (PgdA/CDA1 family)